MAVDLDHRKHMECGLSDPDLDWLVAVCEAFLSYCIRSSHGHFFGSSIAQAYSMEEC